MKKTVNGRDLYEEMSKVQYEIKNNKINLSRRFDTTNPLCSKVNVGISCSSSGTMTVEEAKQFIKDLQKAVELVENFKYQGYEETF